MSAGYDRRDSSCVLKLAQDSETAEIWIVALMKIVVYCILIGIVWIVDLMKIVVYCTLIWIVALMKIVVYCTLYIVVVMRDCYTLEYDTLVGTILN